jgi:hypothetical protein
MVGFISLIVAIYFFLQIRSLQERIKELETRITNKELGIKPEAKVTTIGNDKPLASELDKTSLWNDPTLPPATQGHGGDVQTEKLIVWLKEDWLLKLGALLLLMGFGWLTTYAFLHNWIGPQGRIALGLFAGTSILAFGYYRCQKYLNQGSVFLVLGSSTILLTIFAAREVYGFFTPFSALAIMFIASSFVAFASISFKNKWLSLAGLVMASLAPLLTNSPSPDYIGLFSYLLVVVIGTLWITFISGHRDLTFAALVIVTFYSLPYLFGFDSADNGILILFIYTFVALFFATSISGILKLTGKEALPDLLAGAGSGLLLLWWIMETVPHEWQVLTILAWMLVFVSASFAIYKRTNRKEPFYVYAGVGLAMLVAATSVQVSGAVFGTALTIELAIVPVLVYMVLKELSISKFLTLLMVIPALMSFEYMSSYSWQYQLIESFSFLFVLGVSLSCLAYFYQGHEEIPTSRDFKRTLFIASSVYGFIIIWRFLDYMFVQTDIAVMISLIIYTVCGLYAYLYGKFHSNKVILFYGGAILGFVVGRLLLVEIWSMTIGGKIVTFFAIGALLMSTAFIGRKKKKLGIKSSLE